MTADPKSSNAESVAHEILHREFIVGRDVSAAIRSTQQRAMHNAGVAQRQIERQTLICRTGLRVLSGIDSRFTKEGCAYCRENNYEVAILGRLLHNATRKRVELTSIAWTEP